MSLIEDLSKLHDSKYVNAPGNSLIKIYMRSMSPQDQEALSKALSNPNISAQSISDLLIEHDFMVSPDSVRRYRRRLKKQCP